MQYNKRLVWIKSESNLALRKTYQGKEATTIVGSLFVLRAKLVTFNNICYRL